MTDTHRLVVGAEAKSTGPPPEPVVFLTLQAKPGSLRLYVMDEEGVRAGYAELLSGRVSATSAAEPVFRRLLPHCLALASADEVSAEARAVIGRFCRDLSGPNPVDSASLIAGICWPSDGCRRMFVHRLDAYGRKIDLGWFDLIERRVHDTSTTTDAVVRFCGERYLSCCSRTRY